MTWVPSYDPFGWFWLVAGDDARAWSSAAQAWVAADQADAERTTRIASTEELAHVLRPYGLRTPLVTANDVRTEAGRRIYERYPIHVQLNMQARATELLLAGPEHWEADEVAEAQALQAARDWIKSVRDASNAMEDALPADYEADERWPA